MKLIRTLALFAMGCVSAFGATTGVLTPNPLDFGNQQVGTTSPPMAATLTNTGSGTLTLTGPGNGIFLTGSSAFNFAGGGTCLSIVTTLSPGQTCTVMLNFSPTNNSVFTGTLTIVDDASNSPQVITLTGTGSQIAPPPVTKQGCVGKCTIIGSVTFGGVVGGATLTSVTVTPPTATLPVGQSVTYAASALFSDGSSSDVTTQANWFVTPLGIASNSANTVTCSTNGIATVSAELAGVTGTATLNCQSPQILPQGLLPTAFKNVPYSQQFTGVGGTIPYTFTSSDLPAWTTLTSGGLLSGTPTSAQTYNFHITLTDAIGGTTGPVAMSINVIVQPTEDNRYCNSNETVTGLFVDRGAQPLQNCNYTAIAGTPSPGSVLIVCPPGQTLANGNPDPNCNPTAVPPFYNTVQAAMNAASCGQTIKLYPTRGAGIQNIFNENDVIPPTNCFGGNWITVETNAIASLPPPGTRISPAWAGQASIPGRPAYGQPAVPGVYMPMIRCIADGPNTCQPLSTPPSSSGASGWRFIGIEFTQPHGREPAGGTPQGFPTGVDVCPNNLNGTPQCSPGFTSSLVEIGCTDFCGLSGASHIILDRVWLHGCDDKTTITCKEQARQGLLMQGGRHNSIIDSYVNDFKTMLGVGPSVEGHGMGGGNVKNTGNDFASKIVNNFFEGSSVGIFWGGGTSTLNVYSDDIERRRNTIFKPLLWKLDDPSFTLMGGSVYDAWVAIPGAGYSNDPGTTCTLDAPTGSGPVPATCTVHVAGGQVRDVTITNQGAGYVQNPKFIFGSPASLNSADDTLTNWTTCVIGTCAGGGSPGGAGIPQAFSQTINNAVTGFGDGASMAMSLTSSASVAQTNALWTNKTQHDLATDTNLTTFTLDLDVEASASCADAGSIEFDQFLFSVPDNKNYMFGTQCNKTTSKWQVWDQLNGTWVNTSPNVPCNFTCSVPHHLTEKVHRVVGDTSCSGQPCLIYDSITWDGVTTKLNQSLPAGPLPGGWTSAVGFQEQIDIPGLNKTVVLYSDHTNFLAQSGNGNAKAYPMVGIYNVKNCWEFKNGRRALIEGERCVNVWKGQADQDGFSGLLTPKNSFNNCPTCIVQDLVARYNLSQGTTRAMQLGTEAASGCGVGQVSNIVTVSEVGTTVTAQVLDVIIDQIVVGSTADIAGVGVSGYNGTFIITSINNAAGTFTYTAAGGLASSSGGTASFTPPLCLAAGLLRISIHDMLFDGVNQSLWLSKKGAADGFGGGCFAFQNANPQAIAIQDVTIDHVGCITTAPSGASATGLAAFLSLGYTCKNTQAVFPGITLKNSYGAGGVKDNSQVGNGCYNCSNASCAGGTATALSGMAASSNLLPVSGGFYTTGQVMAGVVDVGGTCTVSPTSCTFSGGGGSGAACHFRFANGTITEVDAPIVGSGYTSAPAVAFVGGTCSVAPAAHMAIGGGGSTIASTKSWCFNNNVMPTAAYASEVPMTPYPTTQGDPTNNTCSRHAGGGNQTIGTWADMLFTNLLTDASGSEIPTGDLRLQGGSPGKNAGDDGLDVGPNIDLINQYTGCSISGGVTICP